MKKNYLRSLLILFFLLLLAGCTRDASKNSIASFNCGRLSNQNAQESCSRALRAKIDQYLYEEIIYSSNSDRCKELSDTDLAQDCKNFIVGTKTHSLDDSADLTAIDAIIESGNRKGCASLPDEKSQKFCQNQFPGEFREPTREELAEELRDRKNESPQESETSPQTVND